MGVEGEPGFGLTPHGAESIGVFAERLEVDSKLEPTIRENAPDERSTRQRKIGVAFSAYGAALLATGIITDLEIAQRHDTHAFYRLTGRPDVVVHVQGYPGMSGDDYMVIRGRKMSYSRMKAIRAQAGARGHDITGNEHEAEIDPSDEFRQPKVEYTLQSLGNALSYLAPELKGEF